jgi:hypothetical protein
MPVKTSFPSFPSVESAADSVTRRATAETTVAEAGSASPADPAARRSTVTRTSPDASAAPEFPSRPPSSTSTHVSTGFSAAAASNENSTDPAFAAWWVSVAAVPVVRARKPTPVGPIILQSHGQGAGSA